MTKVECHECGETAEFDDIETKEGRFNVYSDYGWSFWGKTVGEGHVAMCDECTLAIKKDWQKRIMNGS